MKEFQKIKLKLIMFDFEQKLTTSEAKLNKVDRFQQVDEV